MAEKSIDLTNVDYDDVLHLYRGWRKAEAALKEKTKELDEMREKVQQLQDGHVKFRGQMNALESVKDLTISLQAQINVLQQENKQIVKENRGLSDQFQVAESSLREKIEVEKIISKALREANDELIDLRQKYQATEAANNELEAILHEEKGLRLSAESRLEQADETVEQLSSENSSLRVKLDSTIMRMNQCDEELAHASEQLSELNQEIAELHSEKEALMTAEAEIGVLKGDISRLLRLFEYYPAARGFLDRWYDSDGMAFLGMPNKDRSNNNNNNNSSGGGASSSRRNSFSRGNTSSGTPGKENSLGIDYSGLGFEGEYDNRDDGERDIDLDPTDLTPGDVAQLKRIYGGDPFPMTGSFEEEQELWVPRQAAHEGLHFLISRIPHAPPKVINDFLRKLNKVWLRREKRKFNRIVAAYENRIADLKRQMSNARPYRGVLQEKQIRRLKSQVMTARGKQMKGRPKSFLEDADIGFHIDQENFDEYDDTDTAMLLNPPHRYCEEVATRRKGGNVIDISKEKLLEASLMSLEAMARQKQRGPGGAAAGSGTLDERMSYTLTGSGLVDARGTLLVNEDVQKLTTPSPTEPYLRGAMWLGRNLAMVIEELADLLDSYRSKYIVEVAAAANDIDHKRSSHRLNLLAGSCISEALALTNRCRMRARDILQGASSLVPGNTRGFQDFLSILPIESGLARSGAATYGMGGSGPTRNTTSGGVFTPGKNRLSGTGMGKPSTPKWRR